MEFLSSQTAVRTAALSTTEISVAAGCRPFFFCFFFPLHTRKNKSRPESESSCPRHIPSHRRGAVTRQWRKSSSRAAVERRNPNRPQSLSHYRVVAKARLQFLCSATKAHT